MFQGANLKISGNFLKKIFQKKFIIQK